MYIDDDTNNVLEQLIDKLYPNDEKMRKKLKEKDPDTLRTLSHYGDKNIRVDDILSSIDFLTLIKLQKLAKNNEYDEIVKELSGLDYTAIKKIYKKAKERKLAQMIYKICIGNLSIYDEEMYDGLDSLNLQMSRNSKTKQLKIGTKKKK